MNRQHKDELLILFTCNAMLLCTSLLIFLLSIIFWNGIPAINMDFLFTASRNFGASGGILYQIIGSILLIVVAATLSFPIALGVAIFKSEFLNNALLKKLSDSLIYGLNGIPSIIFGIFGLIFFVNILDTGISWFVGAIILAIMILPTIVMASYQAINSIPTIYRESALSLGLSQWQIITRVLLPQGIGGAITGLLMGLARAIGETAPIMFIATAFSGVDVPGSLTEPVSALPTHILILAKQATDPQALENAWGASLVLIVLVLILSLSALLGRIKTQTIMQR